ncbi:MAG TPA: hypothetical protein VF691_03130 [Cytophagaceae bacterium]|jgi:hypothetical protein
MHITQTKNYLDDLIGIISHWNYVIVIPTICLGMEDYLLYFHRKSILFIGSVDFNLGSILQSLPNVILIGLSIVLTQYILWIIILLTRLYKFFIPEKVYGAREEFSKNELLNYAIHNNNSNALSIWNVLESKSHSKIINRRLSFFLFFFLSANGLLGWLYNIKSIFLSTITEFPLMSLLVLFPVIIILIRVSLIEHFEDADDKTNVKYPPNYRPYDVFNPNKNI